MAPRRPTRLRPRSTPGALSRCRIWPSSYGRMPMLDGAPTTAIERSIGGPSEAQASALTEQAPWLRHRELDDSRAPVADGVTGRERRRLLNRLEVHQSGLVVERRLQQAHLRLQQVALSLSDEKRGRQSHLVAALFDIQALLRQC